MTTDPLNFRDLAFRLSRRPPFPSFPPPEPLLRSRSGHRELLTGVLGGRVAASEPSSVPRDPLARPLRSGPTFSLRFHFPQARRPGRDHRAPPHGAGLGTNSELSACRGWRRAGRRPAGAPEFRAGRGRPGTRCNSPAGKAARWLGVPPPPDSPDPHTHARICTRGRAHMHAFAHARTHLHTDTPARARARTHSGL